MLVRLSYLWERLTSSYWFVPTCMLLGTVGLAVGTLAFDHSDRDMGVLSGRGWFHVVGPEGARAFLSVVASSMITVAGVVFSITVVVLTLASSQYGPRVLRTFFRDRTTSFVFGTFLSTFLFCLIVMRAVNGDVDGDAHVPHLSVAVATVFAIAGLLVLIFFIHHIAAAIQASAVVVGAYEELVASIRRSFPPRAAEDAEEDGASEAFDSLSSVRGVDASSSGYILRIDLEGMVELARERSLLVSIEEMPGAFVVEGAELARVHASAPVEDSDVTRLRHMFLVGNERTPFQDVLFAVRQLVEIAVRALSPGVNDPFTASLCIDYLEAALSEASKRSEPARSLCDDEGCVRVTSRPVDVAAIADAAWADIRHFGSGNPAVALRLMRSMASVSRLVEGERGRSAIRRQAAVLLEDVKRELGQSADIEPVEAAFRDVVGAED